MKREEIITEARKYAANEAVYKNIENGATYSKEEIAERACIYGIKYGLKRHAHDYLVTTKQRILDKENAELKKQQFSLRNERNTFLAQNEQYEQDLIDFNDKLTKAKDIIRTFLNMPMPNNEEVFADVGIFLTKAEQFLKDSEVEK